MIPYTNESKAVLKPGRGIREFSIPADPATFTGTAGIQHTINLLATDLLAGLPRAATTTGASYLSAIHGALGSDMLNPTATPTGGMFNASRPAFANPEVTNYGTTAPNANNKLTNGLFNTEKVQRAASDGDTGTLWIPLQGRTNLNFQLWISDATTTSLMKLELYRDLNSADKIAGRFGVGTGATDLRNAVLVGEWLAPTAVVNQNQPNFATSTPFKIPSGCNLYMIFRNLAGTASNACVGSIWLN